jgi:hypothetical protein
VESQHLRRLYGKYEVSIGFSAVEAAVTHVVLPPSGLNRFESNDWAGVDEAFRPLLSRPPVDTPTHLFLCIALVRLGRPEEAGDQLMAGWSQELADSEPSQAGQAPEL